MMPGNPRYPKTVRGQLFEVVSRITVVIGLQYSLAILGQLECDIANRFIVGKFGKPLVQSLTIECSESEPPGENQIRVEHFAKQLPSPAIASDNAHSVQGSQPIEQLTN